MPLNDPFNPKTGEFADNIRLPGGDDLSELRASMKSLGWLKQFPAIVDERDVVLVGHRRMKVAKQLGIEPVVEKFTFGQGDEADAARLKLAIASNIGFKSMTRDDRQRIAKYLYGEREWTMQQIANALDVSQKQISRDLEGLDVTSKPPSRPKGGRPKGSGKTERRQSLEERNEQIITLADAGVPPSEIAGQVGIVERGVHQVIEHERIRRKAVADSDPAALLSLTAQQKLAAAIRQHQHRLNVEFERRVREEIKQRIDAVYLPAHHKTLADAEQVLKTYRQKGIFTSVQFKKIIACLHPDRVRDAELKERYAEAFNIVNAKRLSLVSEEEEPTASAPGFPKTYQELMALKAKVAAERKAKRNARQNSVIKR